MTANRSFFGATVACLAEEGAKVVVGRLEVLHDGFGEDFFSLGAEVSDFSGKMAVAILEL